MRTPRCIGIAREAVYSPGKVDADRAILEETGAALVRAGVAVRIVEPDRVDEAREADLVFAMCQGPAALQGLRELARAGIPLVHDADAIEACHRRRMLPLLAAAGVPRPPARSARCERPDRDVLMWAESHMPLGVWVKRGDVHATEAGDVCHTTDVPTLEKALAGLAARGVAEAVLEAHVSGPTYKFYGVRGGRFFRAFAGDGVEPVDAEPSWQGLGERGARALGLAVYGGDLIHGPDGQPWLVDVNDWPSFSRCRTDAALAISQYLLARLRGVREAGVQKSTMSEEIE